MAAKRFTRDVHVGADPGPAVQAWASRQGYKSAAGSLYTKGSGFWTAARKVQLGYSDGTLHIEAWVAANIVVRIFSLFLLPAEITIESGGFKGALPRKLGRNEINDLLQSLGSSTLG